MIPVELIIEGIYSYRERTRIDFQPLLDAHLFGIFGSVGSGKSSLLDAITFALYGQVERMSQKDKLAANLFNLEADKAYIEFTFDSLVDGKRYQCIASGKRKKHGPVLAREFFLLEDETPVPIPESDLEIAIGLSYEHFSRTVIVPQGKFQAFLQLTDADRTSMLQHLFNLHRFDLGSRLRTMFGQTKGIEQHVSGRLASLEEILLIPVTQLELEHKTLEENESRIHLRITRQQAELDIQKSVYQHHATLENLTRESATYKDQMDKQQAVLETIKKEAILIQTKAIEVPAMQEQTKQIRIAIEMVKCNQQLLIVQEKILEGKDKLKPIESSIEQTKTRKEEGQTRYTELLGKQVPVEQVQIWTRWKLAWEQLETTRIQLESQGKQLNQALTDSQSQLSAYWTSQKDTKELSETLPESPIERLSEAIQVLENDLTSLDRQIHDTLLASGLLPYKEMLKPELPCPLCGSTHHPAPIPGESGSIPTKLLEDKREALRAKHREVQNVTSAIRKMEDQITIQTERLSSLRQDYQTHLEHQKKMRAQLAEWEMDIQELKTQITAQENLSVQITIVQRDLQEKNQQLATLEANRQHRLSNLQTLEAEQVAFQSRFSTLKEQAGHSQQIDGFLTLPISDLVLTVERLEKEINDILTAHEKSKETIRLAEDQWRQIQIKYDHAIDLKTKQQQVVEEAIFQLIEFIPTLQKEDIPGHLEERINTVTEALAADQQTARSLSNQLAVLQQQIQETSAREAEAANLRSELETVTHKLNNLKTLDSLFRGKGMVDFAASRYLRQILEHANQRFYKMTRHKLRLELGDGNRIMVRDYYHGGALRLVKTLSGGQLFQAALALALSMAEQIRQHRHGDRDFFFLDEGFGTQDRDSLMVVLDTLKALRDENRSVGIISHVDELQQEVNAFLKIRLDPVRGSMITSSHE